jgi:cytochrome P450
MVRGMNSAYYSNLTERCEIGEIIYFRIFNSPLVIINSFSLARSALEMKNALYANPPDLYFASSVSGLQDVTLLQRDGPEHKESRRLFAGVMGSKASLTRFIPKVDTAVQNFLQDLLDNPEGTPLPVHIRKCAQASFLI